MSLLIAAAVLLTLAFPVAAAGPQASAALVAVGSARSGSRSRSCGDA